MHKSPFISEDDTYLWASTDKQDLNNQKLEILEFAHERYLRVDEFIAITISSRTTSKQRRIDELLSKLADSDTLIVTELSRLGRSTSEVIALVNELVQRHIRVLIIKQNLDLKQNHDMTAKVMITLFSLFAELERDLVSLRTKEALAARKRAGVKLGRPEGVGKSKLDEHRPEIEAMLKNSATQKYIAQRYKTSEVNLSLWLAKHGLRRKRRSARL